MKRVLSLLLLSFTMGSCVEQVNLDNYITSKPSGRLVVEGMITSDRKPHQIKLARTGKALPDDPYEPVTGANISIRDGDYTYSLQEDLPGSYVTDSIRGEANHTYTLRIEVDGEVYEASDTMVPVTKFSQAEGIVLGSNNPPKGYVETPLIVFGSNAPAMVNIVIDNPKPDDKYTRLDYYTFPGVDPDYILPKYVDAALPYDQGTRLTQSKLSLSPAFYEFTRALLLETEYKGGLFGSVRANVPTNLSNGALGFFGACDKISRTGTIGPDGRLH